MKIIIKLILCCIFIFNLTGCKKEQNININYVQEANCNHKPQILLEEENRKIYTYCLNDMKINMKNKTIDLKEYVENNSKAIDQIIEILELEEFFSDGGTKIYRGNNLTLVKCNTLDGNRDIYIGNEDTKFKQNFCKNNNYTFIKTYTVKDIKPYLKQQYTEDGVPVSYGNSYEVTLSNFKGEGTTVIINNLWNIKLEKDKTYEFEFMIYDDAKDIKDTTEYIFKNSTIIDVRETTKKGSEQIQEEVKEIFM